LPAPRGKSQGGGCGRLLHPAAGGCRGGRLGLRVLRLLWEAPAHVDARVRKFLQVARLPQVQILGVVGGTGWMGVDGAIVRRRGIGRRAAGKPRLSGGSAPIGLRFTLLPLRAACIGLWSGSEDPNTQDLQAQLIASCSHVCRPGRPQGADAPGYGKCNGAQMQWGPNQPALEAPAFARASSRPVPQM
jgi:hypothetical protein